MPNFYSELTPIEDFLRFSDDAFYARVPDDWLVVITDVEGSTRAIEAGHYKWVNMAGASSIVALANALGTRDFPFVFGGDGATAVIPEPRREAVERYLRAARENARDAFGLNLRVGIVPHRDLIAAGAPVEVARYLLPSGPSIAFFRGEGLAMAGRWVKGGRGLVAEGARAAADQALNGLSCRWAPLRSGEGVMLSIIVKARARGRDAEAVLARVAREIDSIAHLDAPETHPVKLRAFRPERLWTAARAEAALLAMRPRWLGIAKVVSEMLAVRVLDRLDVRLPRVHFRRYKAAMVSHSDYRKYDEQLRMVIDCRPEVRDRIRAALEEERRAGAVFFGLHASGSALMTCFLQSFDDGGHIHFVDGGGGGYAIAAKELKDQVNAEGHAQAPGPRPLF